jgi:hypothetical protein
VITVDQLCNSKQTSRPLFKQSRKKKLDSEVINSRKRNLEYIRQFRMQMRKSVLQQIARLARGGVGRSNVNFHQRSLTLPTSWWHSCVRRNPTAGSCYIFCILFLPFDQFALQKITYCKKRKEKSYHEHASRLPDDIPITCISSGWTWRPRSGPFLPIHGTSITTSKFRCVCAHGFPVWHTCALLAMATPRFQITRGYQTSPKKKGICRSRDQVRACTSPPSYLHHNCF